MLVFVFQQGTVVLDSNAKVNVAGSCGMLILTWNKTRPHYTLSIEFGRPKKLQASGDSSFTWWLSRVTFLANLTDNPEFPNATGCNIDFDDLIGDMIMVILLMIINIMEI